MSEKKLTLEFVMDEKFKIEGDANGHKIVIDQPVNAGGTNAGPTPLDYLFAAHAGCLATVARIIAMQKQLPLRGMKITISGDVNLNALLGKPSDDPVGFKGIFIMADIDGDMTLEQKEELLRLADKRCPVSYNLQHATPVKISISGGVE
ncbi:MAG: OsmC family protein [Kiritimatiellales bacterium]